MKPRITWTCYMHPFSSMGVIAINVVKELTNLGYDVGIHALNKNEVNLNDYPKEVSQALSIGFREDSINIFFAYPDIYGISRCKINIGYTGADSSEWYKTGIPPAESCNKFMDYMLTPSEFSKNIMTNCGVKVPIHIFPHGVDMDQFYYKKRSFKEPFKFLYVGEISRRKGSQDLVEVFLNEYKDNKNTQLILRANTHMKYYDGNDLEEKCKQYENIKIIYADKGHESLIDLYHDANVYVYPSRADWFGMTPFEALATGLPTIATATNGYYEFLKDNIVSISFEEKEIKDEHPYLKGKWNAINKFHLQSDMVTARNLYAPLLNYLEEKGAFSKVRETFTWTNVTKSYLVPLIDNIYRTHFKDIKPVKQIEMKKDPMRVTVGVPTKDRLVEIVLLLQSLLEQTYTNFDVLIIDDWVNFNNPTLFALIKLLRDSGHEVTIMKGERRGPHISSQKILENAKTELILRLDDDVSLRPTFIEELVKVISKDEKIGAVGPIYLNPHEDMSKQMMSKHMTEEETKQIGKVFWDGDNLHLQGILGLILHNDDKPKEVEHFYSGFMYRKSAGIKAGGYEKNLSVVGHREETLFSYKIFREGYKLFVVPTAKAFHFHPMSGGIRETNGKIIGAENWEYDEAIYMKIMNTLLPKPVQHPKDTSPITIIIPINEITSKTRNLLSKITKLDNLPVYINIIPTSQSVSIDVLKHYCTNSNSFNFIQLSKNSTLAEALNCGINQRHLESKYICFLDGQAEITDRGWLTKLKNTFEKEIDTAAVGPLFSYFEHLETFMVSSACMFTSIKTIDIVGKFDIVFGNLWHDVDWCARATQLGFKIKRIENYPLLYSYPFTNKTAFDETLELLKYKYSNIKPGEFNRTVYPFTKEQLNATGIKLNIGCFHMYLRDWVNIDIKEDIKTDKIMDLRDIENRYSRNSVAIILISHCLEHITLEDGEKALKGVYNVLKPGGHLIIEVPNCEDLDGRFERKEVSEEYYSHYKHGVPHELGQEHKSTYTEKILNDFLKAAGFKNIKRNYEEVHNLEGLRFDCRKD